MSWDFFQFDLIFGPENDVFLCDHQHTIGMLDVFCRNWGPKYFHNWGMVSRCVLTPLSLAGSHGQFLQAFGEHGVRWWCVWTATSRQPSVWCGNFGTGKWWENVCTCHGLTYWCLVGNWWVAGSCWGLLGWLLLVIMHHSLIPSFPAFSTSKLKDNVPICSLWTWQKVGGNSRIFRIKATRACDGGMSTDN